MVLKYAEIPIILRFIINLNFYNRGRLLNCKMCNEAYNIIYKTILDDSECNGDVKWKANYYLMEANNSAFRCTFKLF